MLHNATFLQKFNSEVYYRLHEVKLYRVLLNFYL